MRKKFRVIANNEDNYTIEISSNGNRYASDITLTDDSQMNAKLIETLLNNLFVTGKQDREDLKSKKGDIELTSSEKSDTITLRPVRVKLKSNKKLVAGEDVNEDDIVSFFN